MPKTETKQVDLTTGGYVAPTDAPNTEPVELIDPFAAMDAMLAKVARLFKCVSCHGTTFHPLPYGEISEGEYHETNVNYACNNCGKAYSPEQVKGIVA